MGWPKKARGIGAELAVDWVGFPGGRPLLDSSLLLADSSEVLRDPRGPAGFLTNIAGKEAGEIFGSTLKALATEGTGTGGVWGVNFTSVGFLVLEGAGSGAATRPRFGCFSPSVIYRERGDINVSLQDTRNLSSFTESTF